MEREEKSMWNERYAEADYVYGTDPNTFLLEQSGILRGPVLSIAEGEGRNAVYLASLGLDVLGVDQSEVGLSKARALAERRGLRIRTEVVDLAAFDPGKEIFGSIISISAHLPSSVRAALHQRLEKSLKPGGILLLESYSEKQLQRNTGGPKDVDRLLSREILEAEFPNLEPIISREIEREVVEGMFHTGIASVVQFLARKKESR